MTLSQQRACPELCKDPGFLRNNMQTKTTISIILLVLACLSGGLHRYLFAQLLSAFYWAKNMGIAPEPGTRLRENYDNIHEVNAPANASQSAIFFFVVVAMTILIAPDPFRLDLTSWSPKWYTLRIWMECKAIESLINWIPYYIPTIFLTLGQGMLASHQWQIQVNRGLNKPDYYQKPGQAEFIWSQAKIGSFWYPSGLSGEATKYYYPIAAILILTGAALLLN
jgi:hypothetical protein